MRTTRRHQALAWSLLGACAGLAASCAHGIAPALAEREFHVEAYRSTRGAPLPWIDPAALAVPSGEEEAQALRRWLVERREALAVYPPRYASDAEITGLIAEWQARRPVAERLEDSRRLTPELGALLATFWVYGHHVDEPNAAAHAFSLLGRLRARFPDSALVPLVEGMMRGDAGQTGAAAALAEARDKTTDPELRGLADVSLAGVCYRTFRRHRAAVAVSRAAAECPACVASFRSMVSVMGAAFGADPAAAVEEPYGGFVDEHERRWVVSALFGYAFQLPEGWQVKGYAAYEPESGTSALQVEGVPLPGSGLVHGVIVLGEVLADDASDSPEAAMQLLANMRGNPRATPIAPLLPSSSFTHWYRVDTDNPVGADDTVTLIIATGVLRPRSFSLDDHVALAKSEGECEPEAARPGLTVHRMAARLRRPVELAFTYSASKGTYEQAVRTMKELMASVRTEVRASSEVIEASSR